MSVWRLEGYDTETRSARVREYTSSPRVALAWSRIPRIQFTDSGHGIVFDARPHRGKRLPTLRRTPHVDEHLPRLRRELTKAEVNAFHLAAIRSLP